MTSPAPSVGAQWLAQRLFGRAGVWVAYVGVHWLLFWGAGKQADGYFGDVQLYNWWAGQGLDAGSWPVFDTDWVYPAGALVPITMPALLSTNPDVYLFLYMLLVTILNGLALGSVLHVSRGRLLGAWWYLLFLLALGPITITRLDGVSAADAMDMLVKRLKNSGSNVEFLMSMKENV